MDFGSVDILLRIKKVASDPLSQLSETQITLLRFVNEGVTSSKALAARTQLQPQSIDTYLYNASRALGERNRVSAARRFQELERENSQSPSELRAQPVATGRFSGISGATRAIRKLVSPVPIGGGEHDLPKRTIALEIIRVALLGIAGLFVLVLFIFGFLKTFS